MNAKIINKDNSEQECTVTRCGNKLTIEFPEGFGIYRALRNAEFTVHILPTDDEIGCNQSCSTCLTPIC